MKKYVAPLLTIVFLAASSAPGICAPEDEAAPVPHDDRLLAIRVHQARGELDEALALATRLIRDHPDSLPAHMAYQDLRLARGQLKTLLGEYSSPARKKEATADQIFLYGRLLDGRKAVEVLTRILKINPSHLPALCAIGAQFTEMGRLGEARMVLERAEELGRDSAIPANALGWLSEAEGDLEGAERHYRAAIEIDPGDSLPRLNLGLLLIWLERPVEAMRSLDKAAELAPADPMPLLGQGMLRASLNDLEGAAEYYRKAVRLPTHTAASLNLLVNTYLGMEEFDLAEETLKRALELDPKDATTLLNLAYLNLLRNDSERAMEWVHRALRVDPASSEASYFLGLCQEYDGKVRAAEGSYRKAAELDPENPDYPRALGALYTNQGRAREATKAFQMAVELSGDAPEFLLDLAFAWIAAAEPKKALLCFLDVVDQQPDNLTAWMNIGLVYQEKLRSPENAIRAYEEYLSRGGTDPRVREWLDHLKR